MVNYIFFWQQYKFIMFWKMVGQDTPDLVTTIFFPIKKVKLTMYLIN
jgi:hypothetical protein